MDKDWKGNAIPKVPSVQRQLGKMDAPPDGSHLAREVRADLGKLTPEQRKEVIRVADSK